jgi:hypothetical protein
MEPIVLFDNGRQEQPRAEHRRTVVLSTQQHSNGVRALVVLTLTAWDNKDVGAYLQQLNADGQSLTITLGAEELRLLTDEMEQWRRQYGV